MAAAAVSLRHRLALRQTVPLTLTLFFVFALLLAAGCQFAQDEVLSGAERQMKQMTGSIRPVHLAQYLGQLAAQGILRIKRGLLAVVGVAPRVYEEHLPTGVRYTPFRACRQ